MIEVNKLIMESMKSGDKTKLRAYKNLKAEIQTLQTAKNAKPYDEAAEINLISKMVKKLGDESEEFLKAGREDLAKEYREEMEVLQLLLPEPVTEEDLEYHLYNWCDEKNLMNYQGLELPKIMIPKKEMGNAIKFLKSKFPQADGRVISNIVKKYIV